MNGAVLVEGFVVREEVFWNPITEALAGCDRWLMLVPRGEDGRGGGLF